MAEAVRWSTRPNDGYAINQPLEPDLELLQVGPGTPTAGAAAASNRATTSRGHPAAVPAAPNEARSSPLSPHPARASHAPSPVAIFF